MEEAIASLAASIKSGGLGRLARRNATRVSKASVSRDRRTHQQSLAQVAVDTSLVLAGLRPACLLDYCGLDLPARHLDQLMRTTTTTTTATNDECQCYEIQDDGSVLVVNLTKLREWHREISRGKLGGGKRQFRLGLD